jgi:hypothetical protein
MSLSITTLVPCKGLFRVAEHIQTLLFSNWTRYPVSEQDFRNSYASVSAHGRNGIGATNPNDVRFLPLLFVVLAIAVRLAPEHIGVDARSRRVTSLRYYWSCEASHSLSMHRD